MKTGDKVSLVTDVKSDIFSQFTSFKSTQFFVRDFEDNAELLTVLGQPKVEEPSWFEKDSGLGMPNWTILTVAVLIVLFVIFGTYLCI